MRHLATIKTISEIRPIENRDKIVLAIVDGWQVIVQKDQFNVGDKCIYIEIDSVLPEKPEFEFLRKRNFIIKTLKMAGVISQGICFTLDILPTKEDGKEYNVEEDVTDILGIHQYEGTMDIETNSDNSTTKTNKYPQFLMRRKWFRNIVLRKNNNSTSEFPTFVSKTDETRIQNMPKVLNDKDTVWVATEKIDGQSGTFCLVKRSRRLPWQKKYEYYVCSRNKRLLEPDNSSYWKVSEKYNLEKVLEKLIGDNKWVVIQGECTGPGIQKNKYKLAETNLYVFNLIYPTGRVGSITAKNVCEGLGLNFVPIVDTGYKLPDTVNEVLDYAHAPSKIGETTREGVVFRSLDGKQSFKAVDPLFLLKYDE